jgi:hypothetical protein
MRATTPWALACLAVIAAEAPASAQIPMPVPFVDHSVKARRARRANPVKQLQVKVDALKAQLATIKELRNWASTSRGELWKIYSDSLANLMQARAAIFRAKGKPALRYKVPKGFEIEPIRVTAGRTYPTSSSYKVAVVPPGTFKLFTKVTFPQQWVSERKKLSVSFQIYPERYLPMASRYQNTTKAIYRIYAYSQRVTGKSTNFNTTVRGLGLLPGRYFASCVVSTRGYPADFLVSLGVFRVEGDPPPGVTTVLPHYRRWYSKYKAVVSLDRVSARVRGKAIHLGGSVVRKGFARKGQKPVYVEVIAAQGFKRKRVLLRRRVALKRAKLALGGRDFIIKGHGLAPGSYTLHVGAFTEHLSSTSRRAYFKGSKAEQKVQISIP